jgi:hypothetical protein
LFGKDNLLFEPSHPFPAGCLVARSVNSKSSNLFYCNVINASDADVVFKKDQLIGNFSEVEIVNEKFNEDVLNFVPLDTKRLL